MSLDSLSQPEEHHQRQDDGSEVHGGDLAPMDKAAPAHWSFWSYLWRYALFAFPFGVMGMVTGMMESTGYRDLHGLDMLVNIMRMGVEFVVVGLFIAFGVAFTVFIVTTPARRLWAAHREAGWTTTQCKSALQGQKNQARRLRMQTRLRELGLEPMPRNDVPTGSAPTRGSGTPSARHRAETPWTRGLARIRTFAMFATLFAMTGFVTTIFFSPLLNRIDVQTVRCEIVSAEPRTSSGGSRGSASTAGVLIETGCGSFLVSRGVNFDNREEVAATFEPGSEYDFEMGWYSRVVSRNILHSIPTADHYRLVK